MTLAYAPKFDRQEPATTMRAAVLTGAGVAAVVDAPVPAPGPGEVRVRHKGCGVCASNLGPWAGPEWMEFPTAPGALGHEAWGVVDAVGTGVDSISIGDPVATLFQNSYAEFDIGPVASVVKLPPEVATLPFPGEPLACAVNVAARSRIKAGDKVAIVGIGFLGALLIQLATRRGAEVIAISRRRFSREVAQRMGASAVVPFDERQGVIEKVLEITGGSLCDVVIEAAGKQATLDLASELTRVRGSLVIAGYHQEGPRQVNMQQWNWRGIDVINAHERNSEVYAEGMREAVDLVASGALSLEGLITHQFTLEELGAALDATRDRPDGFFKAIILMS